jgi:peptide/nickel transport system ATP-binding protein
MHATGAPLLEVDDLAVDYRTGRRRSVPVVRNVSLDLRSGESLGLVGESGCGKTTLALAMLRLLPKLGVIRGGRIRFRRRDGTVADLLSYDEEALRRFRWTEAAMVYQGALNSLNPLTTVDTQFVETARAHDSAMTVRRIRQRAADLLESVQLDPPQVLRSFPHELSGGMRQRVLIALGLLLEPQLLILDEPTTALDILTQRRVIEVLRRLQEQLGFALIFVSHDLALAAELADRVATMYGGRIIELGPVREVFYRPKHPYTIGLIDAVVPVSGGRPGVKSIPGAPPGFGNLPAGCAFRPRCAHAHARCHAEEPPPYQTGPGHQAACFLHSHDTAGVSGGEHG